MSLPLFYQEHIDTSQTIIELSDESSRHIVQVLRMKAGESLQLTDGNGHLILAEITEAHKKKCVVSVCSSEKKIKPAKQITIAISPVKNNARFEWFLEKATEIGVQQIVPLICQRTEKQHFRFDRMKGILISAMLQSKQFFLPKLLEPTSLATFIQKDTADTKLIAHCLEEKKQLLSQFSNAASVSIMIGPEGDFDRDEIEIALKSGYQPVSLGENRLRTETAGMMAAAVLNLGVHQ